MFDQWVCVQRPGYIFAVLPTRLRLTAIKVITDWLTDGTYTVTETAIGDDAIAWLVVLNDDDVTPETDIVGYWMDGLVSGLSVADKLSVAANK